MGVMSFGIGRNPRVARRLITYIVVFSSCITLITTGIQLYIDYKRDINFVHSQMEQVESSYLDSIRNSLWAFDEEQLTVLLNGVLRLRDIEYISVISNDEELVFAGTLSDKNIITENYDMVYLYGDREINLGVLRVVADLDGVYGRLFEKVWIILASNGVKTFSVAIFILVVFQGVVTRHLERIAAFARGFVPGRAQQPLVLDRKVNAGRRADELDQVVTAINDMCADLANSYEGLRASEARFKDFAEGATDWCWEMDSDLRYSFISLSHQHYSGVPAEGVIGHTHPELYARVLPKLDAHEVEHWQHFNRLLETRQTFRNFEHKWVRPDGEVSYFLLSGKPVFDAHGNFAGYRGVGSDITERKRHEERLREDLEQLVEERTTELRAAQDELLRNERLTTLGQLTATVSHELRNPLGAMRASIAAIKKLTRPANPLLEDSVAIVDRSITRCDNIVGELLDYSRLRPLRREPTIIDGWLGHLLDEYDAPPGVEVRRELDFDAEVAIDRDRLRRALLNVLDNAAQAMAAEAEDGGVPKDHVLSVATRGAGGRLEIVIADNGPGIPEPNLERIFEPLYSTRSFGVGLGLPLVQRVMEQHDGAIEVESEAGLGTRVRLWLPLDDGKARAA